MSEKHETSVTLEVEPLELIALVIAVQPLLGGPLVALQGEGVQGLCHSLFEPLHILKIAASDHHF